MNRVGLGLAIGAGYFLGRTRKLKLALAVGSVVAGKRMHLSPRAVADLVSQQLLKNPQFKEIGDQLRDDLRGVGEAASGALVERQLDALSDRLHGRTEEVREQLTGAVPTPDLGGRDEDAEEETEDEEPRAEDDDRDEAEESEEADGAEDTEEAEGSEEAEDEEPSRKAAAKRGSAQKTAKKTAKKAPTKKAAAKKTSAGRTAPKKAAQKRSGSGTSAGRKTAAARGSARGGRASQSKGGDER
ncbi:DNA primase [Streptomyces sp. AS02]|uniref:DNA primase n=1 Tax=Streptomyces sp. AS02 TaxID=2938946 RepID=UPI0020201358|nr:DNA primase [Streptomyces sp. AS02]MCL8017286.1 DNA primase [Streptomyces sp. AS02]